MDRDAVARPQVPACDDLLLGDVVDDVHSFPGDVIVAEIVIERELDHIATIDQGDRRVCGRHVHPTRRRRAIVEQIIEPNPELAGWDFCVDRPLIHRRDPVA